MLGGNIFYIIGVIVVVLFILGIWDYDNSHDFDRRLRNLAYRG